jgi:hypothetical protein
MQQHLQLSNAHRQKLLNKISDIKNKIYFVSNFHKQTGGSNNDLAIQYYKKIHQKLLKVVNSADLYNKFNHIVIKNQMGGAASSNEDRVKTLRDRLTALQDAKKQVLDIAPPKPPKPIDIVDVPITIPPFVFNPSTNAALQEKINELNTKIAELEKKINDDAATFTELEKLSNEILSELEGLQNSVVTERFNMNDDYQQSIDDFNKRMNKVIKEITTKISEIKDVTLNEISDNKLNDSANKGNIENLVKSINDKYIELKKSIEPVTDVEITENERQEIIKEYDAIQGNDKTTLLNDLSNKLNQMQETKNNRLKEYVTKLNETAPKLNKTYVKINEINSIVEKKDTNAWETMLNETLALLD